MDVLDSLVQYSSDTSLLPQLNVSSKVDFLSGGDDGDVLIGDFMVLLVDPLSVYAAASVPSNIVSATSSALTTLQGSRNSQLATHVDDALRSAGQPAQYTSPYDILFVYHVGNDYVSGDGDQDLLSGDVAHLTLAIGVGSDMTNAILNQRLENAEYPLLRHQMFPVLQFGDTQAASATYPAFSNSGCDSAVLCGKSRLLRAGGLVPTG